PGPCIHYIWSPTVHRTWKRNYFSKYKLLNTLSHQQLEQSCDFYQCPAEHWLKLVGGVFILLYEDAKPMTSVWTALIGPVLITCTLPRKKKKPL
ncbi:unnamed protein product, partial [Staurois parvus]